MEDSEVQEFYIDEGESTLRLTYMDVEDPDNSSCIFRTEEENWVVLRKFDNLIPTAKVGMFTLNGKFLSFKSLYYLSNIANYDDEVEYEMGTVIGMNWKKMNKGRRLKWFAHSLCMSVYLENGKRGSFRFTVKKKMTGIPYRDAHKIHFVALIPSESAEYIANGLLRMADEALDFYYTIRSNEELFMKVVNWINENCVGQEVSYTKSTRNPKLPYTIIETVHENLMHWVEDDDVPEEYVEMYNLIFDRCKHLTHHKEFMPYARNIFSSKKPCEDVIEIWQEKKVMTNFNYKLRVKIDLISINKFFYEEGFNSPFFNDESDYAYVYIPDDEVDADTIRKSNVKDNTFTIIKTGTIKHSGTGSMYMENVYVRFMMSLIRYLRLNGLYTDACKLIQFD